MRRDLRAPRVVPAVFVAPGWLACAVLFACRASAPEAPRGSDASGRAEPAGVVEPAERAAAVQPVEAAAPVERAAVELAATRVSIEEVRDLLERSSTAAPDEARELRAHTLPMLEALDIAASAELEPIVWQSASVALQAGDLEFARSAYERVLAWREARLPADAEDVQKVRLNLASAAGQLGDLSRAQSLFESVMAVWESSPPVNPVHRCRALSNLGIVLRARGDVQNSIRVQRDALACFREHVTEDSVEIVRARLNVAHALDTAGEVDAAREELEDLIARLESVEGPPHAELYRAHSILAGILRGQGQLAEAKRLMEQSLATARERLPDCHPELLRIGMNLASLMFELGVNERRAELVREAWSCAEGRLHPDDPFLIVLRLSLAGLLVVEGELESSLALAEESLARAEATLPAEHLELQTAREMTAVIRLQLGDRLGAMTLFEQALAAREKVQPADDEDRIQATSDLASLYAQFGALDAALDLHQRCLAVLEGRYSPDSPHVARARLDLGVVLDRMGRTQEAREQYESGLKALELAQLVDDCWTLPVRVNLAAIDLQEGDVDRARAALEQVISMRSTTLPADHPHVIEAHTMLVLALMRTGDRVALEREQGVLVENVRAALERTLGQSPREASERLAQLEDTLSVLTTCWSGPTGPLFELLEDARARGSTAGTAMGSLPAELWPLADAARASRRGLQIAVSKGSRDLVIARARDRDRSEAALRDALRERGRVQPSISASELAARLPDGACAVGFRVYTRPADAVSDGVKEERVLAHVLHRDGRVARIELGPSAPIEAAVTEWRESVGKPLLSRGLSAPVDEIAVEDERASSEELRRLVLDPVLAAAGDARELFVCLDGALHLVPLDALESGGEPVGERWRIHVESSFLRLLEAPRDAEPDASPALLLLGGIDYGDVRVDAPSLRSLSGSWPSLPGSSEEVRTIEALFRRELGAEPDLLRGADATREAFVERAPRARWLHVATHGWYAPDSLPVVDGTRDSESAVRPGSLSTIVIGFTPMSLCGLALAGANLPPDERQGARGILSAEELAGLDLARCELAVLSACETNVGIARSGQGIQSLQAALHAAGARAAITSLWKVDDEATRELFEDFYARVWVEKQTKSAALWAAKRTLAARGRPVRDWAGWVLTGAPD